MVYSPQKVGNSTGLSFVGRSVTIYGFVHWLRAHTPRHPRKLNGYPAAAQPLSAEVANGKPRPHVRVVRRALNWRSAMKRKRSTRFTPIKKGGAGRRHGCW